MRHGGKTQKLTPHFSLFLSSAGCVSELVHQEEKALTCSRVCIVCVCVCWCMHPCVYDDILCPCNPISARVSRSTLTLKRWRERERENGRDGEETLAAANRVGSEFMWVSDVSLADLCQPSFPFHYLWDNNDAIAHATAAVPTSGRWSTLFMSLSYNHDFTVAWEIDGTGRSQFFCYFPPPPPSWNTSDLLTWARGVKTRKKTFNRAKSKTQRLEGWTQ